jgi:CheY-like chemotaxis protein
MWLRDTEHGRAMSRALIVDDDAAVRVRIRAVLQSCGFDCVEATDGIDAMRFASESGIDLVVTDIAMPRMDGLDLLAIIGKGAFGANQPPAIVCSAHLDAETYRHRPELDLAIVKISKPFTTEDLMKAVAAVFPEI